jgi:hypothetical protein
VGSRTGPEVVVWITVLSPFSIPSETQLAGDRIVPNCTAHLLKAMTTSEAITA